ncbi:gliding motility-associated C-terminal domain-containing protein [Taibaiella koreensis]|uniref:gliding motility-associated C-terminal domain-containing protein n=1 Tax=Taibaiella koreensis TaxID=1268548 RepID=UPI000E59AB9D|nr:gliding motility-associated C-terminal domain-containing protein [Taibaiella koreensis]
MQYYHPSSRTPGLYARSLNSWITGILIRLLPALFCCFLPALGHSQSYNQRPGFLKANSVWTLNIDNPPCALNFNTLPLTMTPASMFSFDEGIASVADPVTGTLLFYSNGRTCWNASFNIMLNGDTLFGNTQWMGSWEQSGGSGSTNQGVCIVPFINQPGKYYVFSLCGPTSWLTGNPPPPTTFLFYSVVDMSLDGGLGGVVPGQKNIPLGGVEPLSESMIAVPGDNCDIWLMVHDFLNPVFRAFHITRNGVDPNPVITTAGAQIQGPAGPGAYRVGAMAVSPDRKLLAITSCSSGMGAGPTTGVLLSRFDPGTGQVSDAVQVGQSLDAYSVAFSQNNSRLYVVKPDPVDIFGPASLLQYDISAHDSTVIAGTQISISQASPPWACMRLYDGKIYMITPFSMSDSLWIIGQPDLAGTACNFHYSGFAYGAPVSSLPPEVVYAFPPDTTYTREDTIVCRLNGIPEPATLTAPSGYDAYTWSDGSTGSSLSVGATGTYWVLCRDSCHPLIDTFIVSPGSDIPLTLGNDTLLCGGNTLTLNATVPGGNYRWQDGSNGSRYTVSETGQYWVSVIAQGCTVSDSIKVNVTDVRQALGDDITLCLEEAVHTTVTLQANAPSGAAILWSDGSHAPQLPVSDTGIYWVQVTDNTCTGADTLKITGQICACVVNMPNAFSPNADGLNDVLHPVIASGCPVRQYVFNIYNRYGSRVYSSADPSGGWNGTYPGGQPADAGTYMYELSFLGGAKEVKYYRKGDVTLIH